MPKELCGITYYSVVEAAKMLSIHKVTLRRYIQEGRVQATRIGRPYYITEQNLRQIFNKETATKP
jgi:excisionase family DNA binding protein